MKKKIFSLTAIITVFALIVAFMIGQTQLAFAHSEDFHVIESQDGTMMRLEREALEARERAITINNLIVKALFFPI